MIILVLIVFTGCGEEYTQSEYVTLKEIFTPREHYRIVADYDKVYKQNVNDYSLEFIKLRNGELLRCMELDWNVDNTLIATSIDPTELGLSIEKDIPNTYRATIAESSKYLRAVYNAGYELVQYVATFDYIDITLYKDNVYYRVVVLSNVIKVFQDVQVNIIDPATYINEI